MAESFVKTLKRDYAKLANRPDSKTVMAELKEIGSMTTIRITRTVHWATCHQRCSGENVG
jgi:hypothetical protein